VFDLLIADFDDPDNFTEVTIARYRPACRAID
jgi:hypothetical protein